MRAQTKSTHIGYIVEVYDEDRWGRRWLPVMNFGWRQGDARDFVEHDCFELADQALVNLTKSFNPHVLHRRHRCGEYWVAGTTDDLIINY